MEYDDLELDTLGEQKTALFVIISIYDMKFGCVKTECLHQGWQTSGSVKVVRLS